MVLVDIVRFPINNVTIVRLNAERQDVLGMIILIWSAQYDDTRVDKDYIIQFLRQ
jgi:hypothetical protein